MSGFDTSGEFDSVSGATTAFSGQVIASATWNAINQQYADSLTQVGQHQIIRTPVTLSSAGTSYTVAALDEFIFVTANTPNIVLPACATKLCPVTIMGASGTIFASFNSTLVANGAETINGATTQVLSANYEMVTLIPRASGGYTSDLTSVGAGTVTSVGLSLPGIFTVTTATVTTAGTLTASLATQLPNLVWASSSSGATVAPTFRAVALADLPTVTVAKGGTGDTTLVPYSPLTGGTTATGAVQSVASAGTTGQVLTSNGPSASPTYQTSPAGTTPRSYLAGCTMSTAGNSATMSIAAGSAVDSTNTITMALTAIAKTTSSWSVGNAQGGLDTGSIANATWYHFFVIERTDLTVVDVVFSATATPASGPTAMPANYTYYRRIGSGLTDGAAKWVAFTQDGNLFEWSTPILDVNAANPGSSAVSRTLTVPPNVNVIVTMNVDLDNTSGTDYLYLSDLATTDLAVSTAASPLGTTSTGEALRQYSLATVRTNTSKQIRSRMLTGSATSLLIATLSWQDSRGQNA